MQMPVDVFNRYARCMNHLEAEETLIRSNVSLLSVMKPEVRSTWLKNLSRGLKKAASKQTTLQKLAVKISKGVK